MHGRSFRRPHLPNTPTCTPSSHRSLAGHVSWHHCVLSSATASTTTRFVLQPSCRVELRRAASCIVCRFEDWEQSVVIAFRGLASPGAKPTPAECDSGHLLSAGRGALLTGFSCCPLVWVPFVHFGRAVHIWSPDRDRQHRTGPPLSRQACRQAWPLRGSTLLWGDPGVLALPLTVHRLRRSIFHQENGAESRLSRFSPCAGEECRR